MPPRHPRTSRTTPTSQPRRPPTPTRPSPAGRSRAGSGPAWSRCCSAATAASHGWPLPVLLALGLLVRLVPDTLTLAAWAASATTWSLPVHQHRHLAITTAALALADLVAIAT
jgi:hypothetical protein